MLSGFSRIVGLVLVLGLLLLFLTRSQPEVQSTKSRSPDAVGEVAFRPSRAALVAATPLLVGEMDGEREATLCKEITAALEGASDEKKSDAFENLLPDLVKLNPQRAAKYAESLARSRHGEHVLRVVMQTWVVRERDDALAWADSLSDPELQWFIVGEGYKQLGQAAPGEAIVDYTRRYPTSYNYDVVTSIIKGWADSDAEGVVSWLNTHPVDAEANAVRWAAVTSVLAKSNPAWAAKVVLQYMPPGSDQDEAITTVFHKWAKSDGEGAMRWLAQFPEGALRQRLIDEMAGNPERVVRY